MHSLLVWAVMLVSVGACARDDGGDVSIASFAVYTLSRGSGVPSAARAALETAERILESDRKQGVKVVIHKSRIGLEGETKLCAEYADPHAGARTFARVEKVVRGVELVNLVIEGCKEGR